MLRAVLYLLAASAASATPIYGGYNYPHHHHESQFHHDPRFHQDFMEPYHHDHDYHASQAFGRDMFDTRKFWLDLSREMMSIEQMMQDLYTRFPMRTSTAEYVDGKYKITIPLDGFEEKEITVKAKDTLLMVQAVHEGEVSKTYIDARALPDNVDAKGTWTYDGKTLIIVFPLKQASEGNNTNDNTSNDGWTKTETADENRNTKETGTTNTDGSREEMNPNQDSDTSDADVGLRKNQPSAESEDIETNIIPTHSPLDATTYAVDIKDEVEFVPVKY